MPSSYLTKIVSPLPDLLRGIQWLQSQGWQWPADFFEDDVQVLHSIDQTITVFYNAEGIKVEVENHLIIPPSKGLDPLLPELPL